MVEMLGVLRMSKRIRRVRASYRSLLVVLTIVLAGVAILEDRSLLTNLPFLTILASYLIFCLFAHVLGEGEERAYEDVGLAPFITHGFDNVFASLLLALTGGVWSPFYLLFPALLVKFILSCPVKWRMAFWISSGTYLAAALFHHPIRIGGVVAGLLLLILIGELFMVLVREERSQRAARARLYALQAVSAAVTSTLELEEVLKGLVRTVAEVLGLEGCVVTLLTKEGEFKVGAVHGLSDEAVRSLCGPLEGSLSGEVIRRGETVYIYNLAEDERFPEDSPLRKEGLRSALILPLRGRGRPVGVLWAFSAYPRRFSWDEVDLLRAISSQAAVAVENALLKEHIEHLAITDGLTGLFNHRYFRSMLKRLVMRAREEGTPISLLMIDIDHFKRYNDTKGHLAGDELLRHLAEFLRTNVRPSDIVARYGGEEFAIILPELSSSEAFQVAERLREGVEERIGVTVSIGVASFPEDAKDEESLLSRADFALYKAKSEGRNRVCLASDLTPTFS